MKTSYLRIVAFLLVQCLIADPVMAHVSQAPGTRRSSDRRPDFTLQALSLREVFVRLAPQEPTTRVRDLFEPLGRYAVSGQRDLFGWGPAYHLGDRNRPIEPKVLAILANVTNHPQAHVREVLLQAADGDNILYGAYLSELYGQFANRECRTPGDLKKLAKTIGQKFPQLRKALERLLEEGVFPELIKDKEYFINKIIKSKKEFRGFIVKIGKKQITLPIRRKTDTWEDLVGRVRKLIHPSASHKIIYYLTLFTAHEFTQYMGAGISRFEEDVFDITDLFYPKKSFTWRPSRTSA
jgi:hypothetical protein